MLGDNVWSLLPKTSHEKTKRIGLSHVCCVEMGLRWEEIGAKGSEVVNVIHCPVLRTRAKLLSIEIYKDF